MSDDDLVWLRGAHVTLPAVVGELTLLARIGAGGMAEAFLCERRGPKGFVKRVVAKRLLPELADDDSFLKMFVREAKVASLLSHPNLAQVHELVDVDGELFLVMEHVDGVDLHRLIKRAIRAQRALPLPLAIGAVADAALGLAHMHAAQVLHRDVSPDNLVVAHNGVAKLIDFGIAKSATAEDLTTIGDLKGKLAFMPPERLEQDAVGPPSDVWALGVTLFGALTRHLPFASEGPADSIDEITGVDAPRVRSLEPSVSRALDELVAAMLSKDQYARPSATEVHGALVRDMSRDLAASAAALASFASMRDEPTQWSRAGVSALPTRGVRVHDLVTVLAQQDATWVALSPQGETRVVQMPTQRAPLPRLVSASATRVPDAVTDAQVTSTNITSALSEGPPSTTRSLVFAAVVGALLTSVLIAVGLMALVSRVDAGVAPGVGSVDAGIALAGAQVDAGVALAGAQVDAGVALAGAQVDAGVALVGAPRVGSVDAGVALVGAPGVGVDAGVALAGARVTPGDDSSPRVRPSKRRVIQLRGPASVAWSQAKGAALGRGATEVTVDPSVTEVIADDDSTGGRVRVPVVDGVADFSAVPRGELKVLVYPWGKVSIGKRSLGETPIAPVRLPRGHYRVRVRGERDDVTREVDLPTEGATVKVRFE